MKNLVKELRSELKPKRDATIAASQSQYLKNKFPFLGIRTPELRKTVRMLLRSSPSKDWRKEVLLFWKEPEREFHHAAIHWAIHHVDDASEQDLPLFEKLIVTNSWWDTVDWIAPYLIGHLFLKYPKLLSKADKWIESDNLWLRRTAIIYPLRFKEKTDPERLFHYCSKLGSDKEFFVRKAIGWVLREYSKTNPTSVRSFLKNAKLSSLSIREASKYLI